MAKEKRYKLINDKKYEVLPNYDLGSDVVPVEDGGGSGGSDLPEYSVEDAGKVLSVDSEGTGLEWSEIQSGGGGVTLYGPYQAIGTPTQVQAGGDFMETIMTFTSLDPEHDYDETVTLPDADTSGKCFLCSYTAGSSRALLNDISLPPYFPPEGSSQGEWFGLDYHGLNLADTTITVETSILFMSTVRFPLAQSEGE